MRFCCDSDIRFLALKENSFYITVLYLATVALRDAGLNKAGWSTGGLLCICVSRPQKALKKVFDRSKSLVSQRHFLKLLGFSQVS